MLSLHLSTHIISKVQNFDNLFVIEDIKPTPFNQQIMRLLQKTGKSFRNTNRQGQKQCLTRNFISPLPEEP